MSNREGIKEQPKHHGRRYPWSDWFRLRNFILVRGIDYHIMTHGMAQMVRNVACSDRYRLSVGVYILDDDKIKVKVFGDLKDRGKNPNYREGYDNKGERIYD
jgi:hypothetical protein